jgi:hypothetical protein
MTAAGSQHPPASRMSCTRASNNEADQLAHAELSEATVACMMCVPNSSRTDSRLRAHLPPSNCSSQLLQLDSVATYSRTCSSGCTVYLGSGGVTLARLAVSTMMSGWSGPSTLAGLQAECNTLAWSKPVTLDDSAACACFRLHSMLMLPPN